MRIDLPTRARWPASTWTAVVASGLAGTACNVSPPLPSDCPPGMDCNQPAVPSVIATPDHVTTQVGSPVTFHAVTPNVPATGLTYQWSRSSDGGAHYATIAGATTDTLTLPAPNLADDATDFVVTATRSGLSGAAVTHLAVAASPGVVFHDGEFALSDWVATPLAQGVVPAPTQSAQATATGGFPGAWRSMVVQFAPTYTRGTVVHASLPSTWDPASQGAIYVIDYAEDGIAQASTFASYTQSALLLEQAGRRYVSDTRDSYQRMSTTWAVSMSLASLHPQEFHLIDGPACGVGETCPDFSSAGAVMRFGYWRESASSTDTAVASGIDNWSVTVWRR